MLPPALGAVIGYVTNDIAIRMLFRPLREKRILGARVPLTPGIIPKQRFTLAESIGRMVSEHLINEETCSQCGSCLSVCPPSYAAVYRVSGALTRYEEIEQRKGKSVAATAELAAVEEAEACD